MTRRPGACEVPDAPGVLSAGGPIRVLFVCTGNSARSQMAEALLRRRGGSAFAAFSAGTQPRSVHPFAIQVLAEVGIDIRDARSKSVAEFLDQPFGYVVTVCDRARENCPVFPGAARSLHWGFDDPAEATGTEAERVAVFRRVLAEVAFRVRSFMPVALRERNLRRKRSAATGGRGAA